ncbi:MAG TPA: hypothetical protein VGW76_05895 [Pyrinomonadaceae bacterium]|nr:hypothetical protein [Pyrinomonadaceae bacterium]
MSNPKYKLISRALLLPTILLTLFAAACEPANNSNSETVTSSPSPTASPSSTVNTPATSPSPSASPVVSPSPVVKKPN